MKKPKQALPPELLKGLQAGEANAFNAVHHEYCLALIGFSYCIVECREAAEDIVAEAFCRLFLARPGLNSLGHARRFLYMVTRNMSVDHVRARARERLIDCKIDDLLDIRSQDDEARDLWKSHPEILTRIRHEVENLPEKCRRVFKLYFYEERSTAEIADLLQINSQTVLNHKSFAVKNLRKRLGRKLPG